VSMSLGQKEKPGGGYGAQGNDLIDVKNSQSAKFGLKRFVTSVPEGTKPIKKRGAYRGGKAGSC